MKDSKKLWTKRSIFTKIDNLQKKISITFFSRNRFAHLAVIAMRPLGCLQKIRGTEKSASFVWNVKFLLSYKLAWNCHNITIFSFDDPPEVANDDIKISTDGSLKMAKSFSQCLSPDRLSKLAAQLRQIRTLSKTLVLWY